MSFKVAVSGANGFIGRYVIRELISHKVETVAIIRKGKRDNIPKGCTVVNVDIHSPPENVFSIIGKPDVLIHLAWGGLPNYMSLHHFEKELPSHYSFLKQLILSGLPCLLGVGTCLEYGMQAGELSEDMPARPSTPYGFAKDALRHQLQFLKTTVPFKFTWVRLFYLYGDGQAETSLWSQLKLAIERKEKVFPMSDGEQLRDYLPVEEAAKQLMALALLRQDNGIVNVCSGHPISIRRLVESWLKHNKWEIRLDLGRFPYPDYESIAFWGSRKKLDSILHKYAAKLSRTI